jgi:hypothetical protein
MANHLLGNDKRLLVGFAVDNDGDKWLRSPDTWN